MSLTRALVMPFHATSLMLVAFTTAVLSLFGTLGESHAPGQLLVTWLMLSWLNKYAFAMLDHAAHGRPGAPVASTEMLGPLGDLRVLVHPAIGIGLAVLTWTTRLPAAPITVAALLLMPASLAGMAMTGQLRDAVNPLSLWQAIRGLGATYLAPLALMAGFPLLWMARSTFDLSRPLFVLFNTLLGLCLYAGLGGAIHARRIDLDFEPALSPERTQARDDAERSRRFQQMVDRLFHACRARNERDAQRELQAWFGALDDVAFARDLQELLTRSASWGDDWANGLIRRELEFSDEDRS